MTHRFPLPFALALLMGCLMASPAAAHAVHEQQGSFAAGFSHPLFGLDHVLAMVSVGLWAALMAGRAVWALPAAFVSAMTTGFLLALIGVPLPMVEPVILASVIIMGAMVALAARLPLAAAIALMALFGLVHGHAHGAEMGSATAISFLAGFALATSLLHGAGILLGFGLGRLGVALTRGAGGLVTLAGGLMVLGG